MPFFVVFLYTLINVTVTYTSLELFDHILINKHAMQDKENTITHSTNLSTHITIVLPKPAPENSCHSNQCLGVTWRRLLARPTVKIGGLEHIVNSHRSVLVGYRNEFERV